MKFAKGLYGVALALAVSGVGASVPSVFAEGPSAAVQANADAAQPDAKSYRLTYTITERDGNTTVGTKHYSIVVTAGGKQTSLKQGSRVPIVTGSYGTTMPAGSTQVQYLDVGLNVIADLELTPGGAKVRSKIEQSSIAAEKMPSLGAQDPVVRQVVMEATSILTPGKPLMLGSLDVPDSTRHTDIDVVLENIR